MKFSSHAKTGAALGVGLSLTGLFTNNFEQSIFAGFLAFCGANFPDLDTDSIPSRWTARIGVVVSLVCFYLKTPWPVAWMGLMFFIAKSDKHRGFTHKYVLVAFCVAFVFYPTSWPLGLLISFYGINWLFGAFGVGVASHLLLDDISPWETKNWV
jgi:membrane-bound metal-dependent hydrolase YbcI (DUF457 family)